MKILMVSEDVPLPSMGGLAIHALSLAAALRRRGHEVDFLCSSHPALAVAGGDVGFGGRLFPELSGHTRGWGEHRLGCFLPLKRTLIARHFARTIMRRARAYDVVHYHGHFPNVAAFIPPHINFVQTRHDQGSDCLVHTRFRFDAICKATDARTCADCIAGPQLPGASTLSTLAVERYRREVASAFRRHKTIFVSEFLRRNFTRTAGPGRWGHVVHNFVDRRLIEGALQAPVRPLAVASNERILAFVGKLYPPKGIARFLECAVPMLAPHSHIVIIGDGPQESMLRVKYECDTVHFLGWKARSEALAMLAGSDALVVPSTCEEACATTVLEGLALNKPTYALAEGGTPELARYERYPGQLSLHADFFEMCAAAATPGSPAAAQDCRAAFDCTEDEAASRVLDVYATPAHMAAGTAGYEA